MFSSIHFDVIIIGGSYSGLSAAMALGRSLRRVLVIDSGLPCNRQTPHSHNFLTQDGETPQAIAANAREQVSLYPSVNFLYEKATHATKRNGNFTVETQSGTTYTGRRLLFATGIADQIPSIKGFAACWGISVIHCPYCHGYEFHGQKTGLWANGERAYHLSALIHNLTDDLSLLTNGRSELDHGQRTKLENNSIPIIEDEILEIEHEKGKIRSIVFRDGSRRHFDALYAALPFVQHSDIPVSLGCELTEAGYIKVDPGQKTTIDGVFACGDNSSPMRSVAGAVASGNIAGAMINSTLAMEDF